jgi:hypothetical protein
MRYRLTVVSILVLGALLVAGAASARLGGPPVLDRGIVQWVSPGQVVLRLLDGNSITITIGPRTKVFLNDTAAQLSAIQPGYVASALHDGNRPAVYLRAVGRAQLVVDKGVIAGVSSSSVVLRTAAGLVTITVGPSTSVQLNGRSARLADLRPGYAAEVSHRGSEPALQIRARGAKR